MRIAYRKLLHNRILALATIAIAIVFFIYDLFVDAFIDHEYFTYHFIIELIVFLCVSMALIMGVHDLLRLRTRLAQEEKRLDMFSRDLAESINIEMEEWRMTPSEKDVAWFIIKGYRFSEIAQARGVKENTVRLQATSLYSKAGVSGRSEFVAEIIQSLLLSIPTNSSKEAPQPRARSDLQ